MEQKYNVKSNLNKDFITNENKREKKIYDLVNLSDQELKKVMKEIIIEKKYVFDWDDFNQKIFELKNSTVKIGKFLDLPEASYYISGNKLQKMSSQPTMNNNSTTIKVLKFEAINKNLINYIVGNVRGGCHINQNYLFVYETSKENDSKYTWVFNESEEIKKALEHIYSKMKQIIADYNKKNKIIDDFFGDNNNGDLPISNKKIISIDNKTNNSNDDNEFEFI